MLAAGVVFRDLRLAAELSHPGYNRIGQEAPLFEIGSSRAASARSEGGIRSFLEAVEIVAVRIPKILSVVVPIDGDQRHAMLDQPPGKQHALSVYVAAVAIANRGRLLRQVERLSSLGEHNSQTPAR